MPVASEQVAPLRWSRLPTAWIFDGKLAEFRAGASLGSSIAALKLYLALVLSAENNPISSAGLNQGSAGLSYERLMTLTDMARASVALGLKKLQAVGLIRVVLEGRKNRYFLSGYGNGDHWMKVPNGPLFRSPKHDRIGFFYDLSSRREADLSALKLYLLFCAHLQRGGGTAQIGYPTIWKSSGIPLNRIRRGISVLLEHSLIRVEQARETGEKRNLPNQYRVLGL